MRLLSFVLLLLISNSILAQSITGKVVDSDKGDVTNAVISLIATKDSTLIGFVRLPQNGNFIFKKPNNGIYIVLVTHPNYADYVDTIDVNAQYSSIPNIQLQSKRKVLEAVIVKAQVAPIRMKGDTIIYTADSFKVKDGGTVEDLFKKLPGFTVDRNGGITTQGKAVQNLLVDGEVFFGNDPAMVSKTLAAGAVDKVEVYEKQSDQAAFTGIDDGERQTTVNLKLKASAKKGTMGKISAAGGTPDNYDTQAMIQAFKDKRKLALYGLTGNIGNTDLGWDERETYGGESGYSFSFVGDATFINQEFDESEYFGGGAGIPKNWNLGTHYNNKSNNGKQSINLGYKFNKINTIGENRSYNQTFLPDSTWNSNSGSNSFNSKQRNKISAIFDTKIDSANNVKVTIGYTETANNTSSKSFQDAFSGIKNINSSNRTNTNNSKTNNITASLLWMHKFKKARRTLSLNTKLNNNETEAVGNLFSENTFYKDGNFLRKDTIDQLKTTDNTRNSFNTNIVLTEPLTKRLTAELSYNFSTALSDNNQNSYDKDNAGKYNTLAPLFSNNFLFKNNSHSPRLAFNYTKKKTVINIGTRVAFNTFDQLNKTTNLSRLYKFTNFFPSASFRLGLPKNTNLSFNYNGNGVAPTLDQLQPIQNNNNPFFIYTGNPNLQQSFSHSISSNFGRWNLLSQSSFWGYFDYSFTQNDFTNFSEVDSLGRTVSKTVNVNGNNRFYLSGTYSKKIKKLGIQFSFGPNMNSSKYLNYINGLLNNSRNYSYGLNIRISDEKNDKNEESVWYYSLSFNPNQNIAKSSINTQANAKFWRYTFNINGGFKIAKGLIFNTDINLDRRQKDLRFPQTNNFALWNAELEKTIIKNKWLASLSIKDILNQNRGYFRNFSGYTFNETFSNTLRRYYLATITYKFNTHKAKQNAKK